MRIDYASFNELQAWLQKEAKKWPADQMYISGPEYPPTPVPMIAVTMAEAIVEAWLSKLEVAS